MKMKNEKYGFVYLWYDKKHKRYYVGCHWGSEDDGYICSSSWMNSSYKKRPNDFKRRTLIKVTNKSDLLEAEYKYLSLIKPEEIKVRYYNLHNHKFNHWSTNTDTRDIRQKISENTKAAMQRPEVRKKYLENTKNKDNRSSDPSVREKRRETMIATMAEKYPTEDRIQRLPRDSDELIEVYRDRSKELWANRTEEERRIIGDKISKTNKGLKNRLGHTNSEEHRRKISESLKGKTREAKICPHCGTSTKSRRWHFDYCKDRI